MTGELVETLIVIGVLVVGLTLIVVIAARSTSRSRAAALEEAAEQEARAEHARQQLAMEIAESPDKQFSALAIPQLDALEDIRDALWQVNRTLRVIRFRLGWVLFILIVPGLIGLLVVVMSRGSAGQ